MVAEQFQPLQRLSDGRKKPLKRLGCRRSSITGLKPGANETIGVRAKAI
jgi:hypothetical protein